MASDETNASIDTACETAKAFVDMYYNRVDGARHNISKLYLDTAILVWNGNGVTGSEKIQKYIQELPVTNHQLKTLDAQPMAADGFTQKLTFLVQACGDVTYQNHPPRKTFQQSFMVCAVDGKWKIVTDCYRLQDPSKS